MLGAPKCGTTALMKHLSSHPQIHVSRPKEPNYFSFDLNTGGARAKTDQEYLERCFSGLDNESAKVGLDGSVWYLYSEVAVQEILRFAPDAKMLVMVRNPVDMAYSLHSMLSFLGHEDEVDFMNAWNKQEARRSLRELPSPLVTDPKVFLYRDVCSLGSQLERLFTQVERSRVHIELQDDLKQRPRDVHCGILAFMGLEDFGKVNFEVVNAGRRTQSRLLFALSRNAVARKTVISLKRLMGVRSFGIGRRDLAMTQEIRSLLANQFAEEIDKLEEILARDLSKWRRCA